VTTHPILRGLRFFIAAFDGQVEVFITTTSGAGDSGHSIASSESSTACPDVLPGHPPRGVTRQKYCDILHDSQVSRLASFLRASRTRDLPNLHGISDLARDVLAREGLPAMVKRFNLFT